MTQTKGFILLSYKSCHPDQKGWPRRTYLNNFHTPVAHAILYLVCPGFPGLAWDLPHLSRRDPATLGGLTTCIWKLPDELRRAKSGSWRGQGTLGTPGQDRCQELPGRARGFPDPSRRKLPGKLPRRPSQPAVGTARKHERCGGGLAPARNKHCTISKLPTLAAKCKAVMPRGVRASNTRLPCTRTQSYSALVGRCPPNVLPGLMSRG